MLHVKLILTLFKLNWIEISRAQLERWAGIRGAPPKIVFTALR